MLQDVVLAALLAHLELDLAAQGRDDRRQVPDAGDGGRLAGDRRAAQGGRRERLGRGDAEARRDARAGVHRGGLAHEPGEPRDDLEQVRGDERAQVRLLADEVDLVGEPERVVRADLGAEPVLERRDDPSAVGVVLGVRARHEQEVERQAQRVAADLDVALLEHVEQRHLDPLGEVGELVDREDAAVRPRHEAVVHGLRVAERATLGDLHRVDVADEVADARVRRRELLAVPLAAVQPADRGRVPVLGHEAPGPHRHGFVRVLVELAALDHRRPLVEQPDEGAQQAGLALAALAEQDEVVPGEQGALELRAHGVLEADDAGERVGARGQGGEEVVAQLVLDAAQLVPGGAQGAERARQVGRGVWGEVGGHRSTVRRVRLARDPVTLSAEPGMRTVRCAPSRRGRSRSGYERTGGPPGRRNAEKVRSRSAASRWRHDGRLAHR